MGRTWIIVIAKSKSETLRNNKEVSGAKVLPEVLQKYKTKGSLKDRPFPHNPVEDE